MLMIRFDIEHLTGKEAIELVKEHANGKKLMQMPPPDAPPEDRGPVL